MDMCFSNLWKSLISSIDVSSCVFGNDTNEIEPNNAQSTPHKFPHEYDIIGEDDANMHEFINDFLNNLENNASFYPSIQ
jgi:hypothetical protein